MRPEDARNNFPVATKVMKDTFFHGTSPVITKEQIEYIGQKVDTFMSMFV
jgi:dTDP-4-amino-4,6-dideoxygalactose transaminase